MINKILIAIVLILALSGHAMANVSPEEAAKLNGPVLTPVGAEKAASHDGLIPAWTGGITKGADGWYYEGKLRIPFSKFDPKKSGLRPDPFPDDKILFTITAQNMAQYADKLSDGMKAMLTKYPNDVKYNVYPSRRSMAYSDRMIEMTKKCALNARLEKDGKHLVNAREGIPFPMPANGLEAVWNHLVRWSGTLESMRYNAWLVNAAGRKILTSDSYAWTEFPYWDPNSSRKDLMVMIFDSTVGPANRSGEGIIVYHPIDRTKPQLAWQYLPGQRRVKLAPEIAFDGPSVLVAGAGVWDETYVFNGSPERFNWKVLGKKELVVPYNCYKAHYWTPAETLLGRRFLNSAPVRYEVHRVWIVEGTLKPTERHVYKKRMLYLDEDSWNAILGENYDANGKLWRVLTTLITFSYDYPAPVTYNTVGVDLISGIYYIMALNSETGGCFYVPGKSDKDWSPAALAGRGVR